MQNVKHKAFSAIEMLEPYPIPAVMPVKNNIAFEDVSKLVLEKHEKTCSLALEVLENALQKPLDLHVVET